MFIQINSENLNYRRIYNNYQILVVLKNVGNNLFKKLISYTNLLLEYIVI